MPSAQINIGLNHWRRDPWPPEEILYELVGAGWSTYSGHLPVGNSDLSSWVYNTEEFVTVIDIFKTKYAKKEVNGIKLSFEENHAGGIFLFWPEDSLKCITIDITNNPQMISMDHDYQIIDIQWYINRLFPVLNDNFGVGYLEFIHYA